MEIKSTIKLEKTSMFSNQFEQFNYAVEYNGVYR